MTQPGSTDARPLQRCCRSHPDLATLTQHLVHDYRQLPAPAIVDTIWRAHTAADIVGLSVADRLETVELITRYQLEDVNRYQQEATPAG